MLHAEGLKESIGFEPMDFEKGNDVTPIKKHNGTCL